jgi:hypothetical protein
VSTVRECLKLIFVKKPVEKRILDVVMLEDAESPPTLADTKRTGRDNLQRLQCSSCTLTNATFEIDVVGILLMLICYSKSSFSALSVSIVR